MNMKIKDVKWKEKIRKDKNKIKDFKFKMLTKIKLNLNNQCNNIRYKYPFISIRKNHKILIIKEKITISVQRSILHRSSLLNSLSLVDVRMDRYIF